MSDCLEVDCNDAVWTLTLNRPEKRNALDAQLVEALIAALEQARVINPSLLVIRAQGKSFCAGFDFTGFETSSEGELLWRFVRIEQMLQLLHALPVLTVALVQGQNFGAGVDLMAACKHRVATPDATFRMPGLKFGLVLGTRRLAQLVGVEQARQIQQVAKTVAADHAKALNLVTEIASVDQWDAVLGAQSEAACVLSADARAALYRVLREDRDDADLAALVRSVARPGLKDRIAKYRAGD